VPETPYVTDEAWQLLGKEQIRHTDPVSIRHIREYLAGADDWNPLYHDEEYATNSVYGGIVAPPLFFLVSGRRVVPVANLLDDGQYDDLMIPGVFGVSVLAGWDIEVEGLIRVGDVLTIREKVSSIEEKEGRNGRLILVQKESTYSNQHDERIARDTQTVIYR